MNIEDEVEGRKKRAIDLKLDVLVESFYNELQFYVSHQEKEFIKKIEDLTNVAHEGNVYTFSYNNCEYSITKENGDVITHELDDTMYDKDIYTLVFSGKRVFEIEFIYRYEEYDKKFAWHSIDAFIESEWIKNLKNLLKQIMPINDAVKSIANEERKETYEDKLKENFGIE